MKGKTWVTVELWDEMEDGTEVAQQYDVECSYYCISGTFEEPPEYDIDIIRIDGAIESPGDIQLVEIAVRDLDWSKIISELSND
jgi:hypothetical protein